RALEAIPRIEAEVAETGTELPDLQFTAVLLAMQGRFDEGRARAIAGRNYFQERGLMLRVGGMGLILGPVEILAGDLEAAEREYASSIGILRAIGETGVLSTLAAEQSGVLYRLGRRDEMEAALLLAREN